MNELKEEVNEQVEILSKETFRNAGRKWAVRSLDTFDGEVLRKALLISVSISEFCNELER